METIPALVAHRFLSISIDCHQFRWITDGHLWSMPEPLFDHHWWMIVSFEPGSILLATPLFIWRTLQHQEIPIPNFPIQSVDYCFEQWPTKRGRAIYSAVSILIQYALPIVTVSFAHVRISYKLRYRLTTMNTSVSDARKQQARQDQLQKTNRLLVAIAIIFGVCWLPLNIL